MGRVLTIIDTNTTEIRNGYSLGQYQIAKAANPYMEDTHPLKEKVETILKAWELESV
jgi:hypothetical protein